MTVAAESGVLSGAGGAGGAGETFVAATLGALFCVSATGVSGVTGCAAAEWPGVAAEVGAASSSSALTSGAAGILITTTPGLDLCRVVAVSVARWDTALGATQSYLHRCAAGMSGNDDMEELR